MTRLIVCCDGTWNVPDEVRHGQTMPTNVARLARAVAAGEGTGQLLYYETGVGTSPDEHLLGGAFGLGLSQNIRNAYRFLARSYVHGDEIFLFGFSRGAYTARSLAGLIHTCGLLRAEHQERVEEAFALYRDRSARTHPRSLAAELFREMYSHDSNQIMFIGVWDTVGAIGIPDGVPGWSQIAKHTAGWEMLWGFHDTQLGPHVRFGHQALAIDEQRLPFKPTPWTGEPAPGQTIEQVWFAGTHTEVGGGSADPSLSDIALLWMVDRAQRHGLVLKPTHLRLAGHCDVTANLVAPDFAVSIVDSRHGPYRLIHPYHRLREIGVDGAPGQALASSVVRRLQSPAADYSPPGIDDYLRAGRVVPVVPVVEEPLAVGPTTPAPAVTPAAGGAR